MRTDGGEARKITDAKEGVSTFALSHDGKWLVYRSGKTGEEQLYRLPIDGIDGATAEALTKQVGGVGSWAWAPDDKRIYFAGADVADTDEKVRREKKFTVNIRNAETPLASLWAIDLDPRKVTQLIKDSTITVADLDVSPDGKWVGFRGISADRYKRNITEQNINSDPFLLDVSTGQVERLVKNEEVGESLVSFSPDSRWIAFSAPDDLEKFSMKNDRIVVHVCGPDPRDSRHPQSAREEHGRDGVDGLLRPWAGTEVRVAVRARYAGRREREEAGGREEVGRPCPARIAAGESRG
jgi:dipeptidyl aminopeptidase/acylaminoacyl peptidase